jgi:putative oxidoreductase
MKFLTILRALVGALFVGHGTQKLFGWFGGHGPDGTGQFFESLGLKPGKRHAQLAGAAEAGGGALLATGFLTPLASTAITGTMVQAIRSVHGPKGPWVTEGGWEYNAVLIGAVIALAETGPGPISLDRALGTERKGAFWAAAALGAGVAGPLLVDRLLREDASDTAAEQPAETVREQPLAGDPAAA